ncbi:hypothetical protein AYI68_g7388 [Smittium mucronatum]|uniref:Uncharacterized protein n=1 Tax=Smittium mucronatum TaxID=133383 RepID=A0A1R0GNV5_9FUNG|nr:hypothetical protein AYI68_g7388 [Smittium mucronatum]
MTPRILVFAAEMPATPDPNTSPNPSNLPKNQQHHFFSKLKRLGQLLSAFFPKPKQLGSVVQKKVVGKAGLSGVKIFWLIVGISLGLLAASISVNKDENSVSFADFQKVMNSNFGDFDLFIFFLQDFQERPQNQTSKPEGLFEPAKTLKNTFSLKPKFNVVIIPGILNSGLENWNTQGCMNSFFRCRIWSS